MRNVTRRGRMLQNTKVCGTMALGDDTMTYTFAPLLVRIVFYFLLGIILAVILFLWTKKHKSSLRITALVVIASVFLVCSFSTVYSMVNPRLKTITCTYVDYYKSADQINPFSRDCEWLYEGERLWIELDTITLNAVLQEVQELEKGHTYTIVYEERENLILGVREE